MVSSPSSCPLRSGSASTTDPLKAPSNQSDPASTVRRARSSERAFTPAHTHASDLVVRSRFSSVEKTLVHSHSFSPPSSLQLNSTRRARVPPLFFTKPPPLALAFRLFSTKPRPLSTPALPSRTCWKLPEGRVFPPNRRRSHRCGILLLPSQGEIHRGDAICSGEGGAGAACFPSSKARPPATVCRGRTRWLLRRRGLVVVVMVAWLAFVVMVAWLALWLRWLLCG